MRSTFCEESRRGSGPVLPSIWAVAAVLAGGACLSEGARPLPPDPGEVAELAALMEDGALPDTMKPGPARPPLPPRFCEGSGGTGGSPPPIGRGPIGGPIVVDAGAPTSDGGVAGSGGTGMGGAAGGIGSTGGIGGVAGTGGVAGIGGTGGTGGPDPSCASQPIGFWRFDDCNDFNTQLFDSSFNEHSAFRNVDLVCEPGQEGLAVSLVGRDDLVYAPDQPSFALDEGVTVAAWVKPDRLGGVRTLFRKRDGLTSAFALVIHGESFQFIVRLDSGRFASVSTPAVAGKFTHVAATYDNRDLRLYVDGLEVGKTRAPGTLASGVGPLLIGNDILGRRFQGLIDNAWFNTMAAPASTILELTCVRSAATAVVTPAVGPAVQAGTPVSYELALTNNNGPTCAPAIFQTSVSQPQGFRANPSFAFLGPVASGATVKEPFSITSPEDIEPGSYPLNWFVFSDGNIGMNIRAQAQYVVAEPTGCHVSTSRALTIRDVGVVDDPFRTSLDGPASDPRTGAWSFGRMMERLSRTDADAPDVTEAMFRTFLGTQTINGFPVAARPAMDPLVLAPWRRRPDGKLDLARAPMRLLAIVNRLDLKDLARGKAGEGRMVYGVLGPAGNQMEFTVILEYLLPAKNETEYKAWADSFHALQSLEFPSEEYNAALQAITDRFTGRNAVPDMPNGSALIDIRTNEIDLSFVWQLREFHISPTTGLLDPVPLFQTPDFSLNGSERLGRFINANETAIVGETHEAPLIFEDQPFAAGAVFNNIDVWNAPGITNPEARHKFSLNTCNGCHGGETQTAFLQIFPRSPGQASQLAGFQTGITVFDRFTRTERRFSELGRRRKLLEAVVCPPPQP